MAWAGSRYSVPGHLAGEAVAVRATLDGQLQIRHVTQGLVASHTLADDPQATVTVAEHHAALWAQVSVQERSLDAYDPDAGATQAVA